MAAIDTQLRHVQRRGSSRAARGAAWVLVYALVAAVPLLFTAIDGPAGRGFWRDLSVALGFVGLSMLGLQFAVTARIRPISSPFGLDALLRYHRWISLVATGFIVAHPAILLVRDTSLVGLLNPFTAPWRARAGLAGLLAVVAIVATSVWRTRLRLRYESWRVLHGVLAVAAVAFALAHVGAVGYYVSAPWKQVLWVAMSLALVGLLAWVRVVKPLILRGRPYRVAAVEPEAPDVWTVRLRPDGHDGLRFEPGQFAWLTVGTTPFDLEEHPFSFSSSAETPGELALTIKALGDFTSEVSEIEAGATAYLDGPYGVFTIDRTRAPGFVFVAGGIGITPVISMLRTLADRQDRRPFRLIYADTRWQTMAFRSELEELQERLDLQVTWVVEEPHDGWHGERGFVTAELLDRTLPSDHARFEHFVCGPPAMLTAVDEALRVRGVPASRIHSERFDLV